MSASFNVLRFDTWIDPIFDATLARHPGIKLQVARFADSRETNLALLRQAHALHMPPARDVMPADWYVTRELLQEAPNLLCVSAGGAGYDTVDAPACTEAGVALFSQIGGNAPSVAEHAIGLMLALSHRIVESDRRLRGSGRDFTREDLMGHEIGGRVLGVVGIGHTGSRVTQLARALGMRVLATDPHVSPEAIRDRGAEPVTLAGLIEQADIVSLHCPRLPETLRMFGAAQFAAMKRGSLFISTARGGIHDENALAAALASGHLAGAGLDVWEVEPPAPDHPLLASDKVIASFHTAGVTHEGRRLVARIAAEGIVQVAQGDLPPRLVNPQVEAAWRSRRARVLGLA